MHSSISVLLAVSFAAGCGTQLGTPMAHLGGDAGPPVSDASAPHLDAAMTMAVDAALSPDAAVASDAAMPAVDAATVSPSCRGTATECSRAVYDRAASYAAANPLRNGASWSGWCGALMMRFGGFAVSAPSAIAAYHGSSIVSTDLTAAPIGAFHYWDIGSAGHVGVDLLGGGSTVFMASGHLGDAWGTAIGVNSVGAYTSVSGARYLGWSMEYNGHGQRLSGGGDCGAAHVPSGCSLPISPTATTGVPDHAFTMRLQIYASAHGYTGPIDGHIDAATWVGVQRGLASHGYTGPADGIPASHTYIAFQRIAAEHGYTGPVNGVLGPNSYRGFAVFLNGL